MEPKKQAPKNLLDALSTEDIEKIKAHQSSTDGAMPVDIGWMLLGEFGLAYGWDAYVAAKNDDIDIAEMLTLIEVSRRINSRKMFDDAQTSFIGAVSAQTKKPSSTFKKLTKQIIKNTKVDE